VVVVVVVDIDVAVDLSDHALIIHRRPKKKRIIFRLSFISDL